MLLLAQCLGAATIAAVAWIDTESLLPLLSLLALPALIFSARNRFNAFLIALTYYAVGARAVPHIIYIFFPQQSMTVSVVAWLLHASLLALIWTLAFQSFSHSPWRRSIGVMLALIILTLPPIGLFHWGTPLMAAGLLYPGWQAPGILLTLLVISSLAVASYRTRFLNSMIAVSMALAVFANVFYLEPQTPATWRAISLELGRTPKLWSDEMLQQRQWLVNKAMQELDSGAKVVIFPEAITGSDHRPQDELWQAVVMKAKQLDATVLVGEESWDGNRSGFSNALVGYGVLGGTGKVVVSSKVPMPVGDWKFGLEKGANTDIFGSDLLTLHGLTVSFSMCYEDLLLWTHRGLLMGRADLMISSANQWPSRGTSSERAQDISRKALARMAGVPLLIAKNH